ncbi:MAG: LamG-like jellyroll fold domain-containing protein [Nanoarchaeota archaeon]
MKKGVSTVVATVLIILITVASVTFLWVSTNQFFSGLSDLCEDTDITIDASQGYTCFDGSSKIIGIRINKGSNDVNMSGIEFTVNSRGNSKKFIRELSLAKNSQKAFYFLIDDLQAEEISVAPIVINGNKKKVCDATSKITLDKVSCNNIQGISQENLGIWRLDGNPYDLIGKNNGTIIGTPSVTSGRNGIGQALWLDPNPSPEYIRLGAGEIFNADLGEIKTISAWFKAPPALATHDYIVWKEGGCLGWNLRLETTGNIRLNFNTGTGCASYNNSYILSSGKNYADNQWHYVAGIINRQINKMFLYVDGVKKGEVNLNSNGAAGGELIVGNTWDYSVPFNGTIDEVRIYNRALTADEIKQIYESK